MGLPQGCGTGATQPPKRTRCLGLVQRDGRTLGYLADPEDRQRIGGISRWNRAGDPASFASLKSDGIASQELSALLATDRVIPIVHGRRSSSFGRLVRYLQPVPASRLRTTPRWMRWRPRSQTRFCWSTNRTALSPGAYLYRVCSVRGSHRVYLARSIGELAGRVLVPEFIERKNEPRTFLKKASAPPDGPA
jgi:hypothetical protein